MAIYHYQVQNIGRSSGRSAVACAAYRAGERIYCRETGTKKDYTRKDKVDEKMILAPLGAPDWVYNREELWNEVHAKENRKNSRFCREVNVALPRELGCDAQIKLIREFAQNEYVSKGMVADVCCHNLDGRNPHAHIMLPTREITPEGFGKKERAWNDKKMLMQQREAWANYCNKALEQEGAWGRVDHRSLKEQGINREPTIHLGSKPHPERVARNEAIKKRNRMQEDLARELRIVTKEINGIFRQERAKEWHRKYQEENERKKLEYLEEEKRRKEDALRSQKELAERKARETKILQDAGVWTVVDAQNERNRVQARLDRIPHSKNAKEREFHRLEDQKGLFSLLKNRRLSAEMAKINSEYIELQKEETALQERIERLNKAHEILWERARPERERIERECLAKERREAEREKKRTASPLDDLDPKYSRELRKYNLIVSRRIDLLKELAAAPNAEIRDKMFAEMQKNLGRTKGRGQGR